VEWLAKSFRALSHCEVVYHGMEQYSLSQTAQEALRIFAAQVEHFTQPYTAIK
jgi:hypothetical protein